MNKVAEEHALMQVYGPPTDWTVEPRESPDFFCRRADGSQFGVEITAYYRSEMHARLHNIYNYGLDILQSRTFRHKEDRKHLRVEKVVFTPNGATTGREIDAIIDVVPPLHDRLKNLGTVIDAKDRKATKYVDRVTPVDLVVRDARRDFAAEPVDELLLSMSRNSVRTAALRSRFREIFLVTSDSTLAWMCIPLRATAFAEEIFLCERWLRHVTSQKGLQVSTGDFLKVLVEVLCSSGFADAVSGVSNGDVRLSFASIDYNYSRTGERTICGRDPFDDGRVSGESVSALARVIDERHRAMASEFFAWRLEHGASLNLSFAVH